MNPILLGATAALAWGAHDFAARFAGTKIGVLTTLLCVTATGLIALTLWLVVASNGFPAWQPGHLWLVALMGTGFTLATLWLYEAITRGPFALVSPIVGAYPVTALLFALATGVRPSLDQWLAIAAVIAGVALVALAAQEAPPEASDRITTESDARPTAHAVRMTPNVFRSVLLFSALSHVGFAISITAGQAAAPIYGELEATWLARIFGLAIITAVVIARRAARPVPVAWMPTLTGMGLADTLAFAAVSAAGHAPGAELATVVSSTFGMVAILLAWVFLRERITPGQWMGIAIVFTGTAYLAGT
ncbi:MAG: EamA family transporter [Pseudomonadota bacterium]